VFVYVSFTRDQKLLVGLRKGDLVFINRLTPNRPYMGRTATLTSKRCILCIYWTNI